MKRKSTHNLNAPFFAYGEKAGHPYCSACFCFPQQLRHKPKR